MPTETATFAAGCSWGVEATHDATSRGEHASPSRSAVVVRHYLDKSGRATRAVRIGAA